jgi:hypothetical protein
MISRFAPDSTRSSRPTSHRRACRPRLDRLEDRELLTFGFGSALGIDNSVGQAIATDAAGNVYVAGAYSGAVDFDQDPATASTATALGTNDGFLAKYVPNGAVPGGLSLAWLRTVGSAGCGVSPNGVALDAAGNVYVTGRLHSDTAAVSTYNFGANSVTTSGNDEAFVAGYAADGRNRWAVRMGSGYASGLATYHDAGGQDYVYLAGRFFSGTPTFGPNATPLSVTVPAGGNDLFAAKLDVTGASAASPPTVAWVRAVGSAAIYNRATAVAVDSGGNAYLTGCFSDKVDFDPGPGTAYLTGAGMDAFLWKLTAAGNYVWSGQLGGNYNDVGNAIALDTAADVYVAGTFNDSSTWRTGSNANDFDPGKGKAQLPSSSTGNAFVAKYDSNRNYLWARSLGVSRLNGLALDGAGNVYTTGMFSGTVDFDPGSGVQNLTSSAAGPSAFVSELTAAGLYADAAQFAMRTAPASGMDPWANGYAVALDGAGGVFTTGDFGGTVDFDPTAGDALLSSPATNGMAFISRLSQSGLVAAARLQADPFPAVATTSPTVVSALAIHPDPVLVPAALDSPDLWDAFLLPQKRRGSH